MCGIAGLIRNDSSLQSGLVQMTAALKHRGPDGDGFYAYKNVEISHRRLAIIDLESGQQPISNENGTIWITFNGEIYNYLELRRELIGKGHHFKTKSDTETIVHAYEEWGVDCLQHLRGMFAFGIIDQNKEIVLIARDHFGIKPLAYLQSEQIFAFASEIQALKKASNQSLDLDLNAIDQYLRFQYIPSPMSAYKSIKKLAAAHYMIINFNGEIVKHNRYWSLNFQPDHSRTEKQWLEELDSILQDSVKAHLVSDVPFGAFLSGGIDSSLVVGYMARIMKQPVKTFSIGFAEKDFDETSYARQVADHWKTEHHVLTVEPHALDLLPELVRHFGEPFGDNSAIPTYYVSKMAREHVTMVLTGDGGDELFAGYESYTSKWSKHISPIPEHLTGAKKIAYQIFHNLFPNKYPYRTAELEDWLRYIEYFKMRIRLKLWKPVIAHELQGLGCAHQEYFDRARTYTHFQKAQFADFNTYMTDDVLRKVDIASMMNSLETRTPLLDKLVAEFVATIPEGLSISKVDGRWVGKQLPKKISSALYGSAFAYRKKMGFATPVKNWLEGKTGRNAVRDRLLSGGKLGDIFNPGAIEQVWKGENYNQIWQLLFLQEWMNQVK